MKLYKYLLRFIYNQIKYGIAAEFRIFAPRGTHLIPHHLCDRGEEPFK